MIAKIHDPANGVMPVVGLMSGSGSNLVKIIEYARALDADGDSPYKVVGIGSDNLKSNAGDIGDEYNIPVVTNDINEWYAQKGQPKSDMSLRPMFDSEFVGELQPLGAKVAAYAGYMSLASFILVRAFLGVNVHPADLSIVDESGARVYTGDNAVWDAMMAGESYLRSTTHIIDEQVDHGPICMLSNEVIVHSDETADENQSRLKVDGDWVIFPRTLELIAQGKYGFDEQGLLYFNNQKIPNGIDPMGNAFC